MTQPPLVIPATVEVPQAEKTTLANGATLYTLASDDFEVPVSYTHLTLPTICSV